MFELDTLPEACDNQTTREMANEQAGRLKLWASNIGVFASAHLCLDYRLRNNSDISTAIDGMLETVIARAQSSMRVFLFAFQLDEALIGKNIELIQ